MMLSRWRGGLRAVAGAVLVALYVCPPAVRPVTAQELTPESVPEVRAISPKQAGPGEEVTLKIDGRNFAPGVYVSFSTPLVRAVSTARLSATQLEARVMVGSAAQPGTVALFVSNTGSMVAEVPFTIVGQAGLIPASVGPDLGTMAAQSPSADSEAPQASSVVPGITSVDPPEAARGEQTEVKIAGKNFVKGAKVAFSNPGIRVLETQVKSQSELVARIRIAADAAPGEANLFVINPDEEEAETQFVLSEEVVTTQAKPAATSSQAPTAPAQRSAQPTQSATDKTVMETKQFEVYGLADVASILQARNAPKGTLTLVGDMLRYEESGKEVFAVAAKDIKEIDVNTLLGVNTGTFHVILNSGKMYNFVAVSLQPADSQSILDALRKALR